MEITVTRPELLALHSCLLIVVNNDIPSPSDIGLLMTIMTEVASQDKDTKKEFKLKLKQESTKPLWHCCNIVLSNDLARDHIHATEIMSIFHKLAVAIDQDVAMGARPGLELVK